MRARLLEGDATIAEDVRAAALKLDPLREHLLRAEKAALRAASDADKAEILDRRMREWSGPALLVYRDVASRWLEAHLDEDPSIREAVTLARDLAGAGCLAPFDADLLHLSFELKTMSLLEGEEALIPRSPAGLASATFLRKYAKFLDEKGCPANATRVRGLLKPQKDRLDV